VRAIKWEKQGLIVSPEDGLDWRSNHSGMVSALPLSDGKCRMYLTGKNEKEGYRIGWLDLSQDFTVVYENTENPVLAAGRMGCFDSHGVCMPMVVKLSDKVQYMYYVGWAPALPGTIVNACGLAVSSDGGTTWRRWSEAPLLCRDDRDPIGTGTVFVLRETPTFWRMWYTSFRNWDQLDDGRWRHFYHIRYAESDDGTHWRKPENNVAIDFVDESEYAVARPMVVREPGGYRMWFCTRSVGSTYRIGYAESEDGLTWQRKPAAIEPSSQGWDSEMIEYAYVLKEEEKYVMFYNGNGYGASGTGVAIGHLT